MVEIAVLETNLLKIIMQSFNAIVACFAVLFASSVANADPKPGELFREYTYTNTNGDAGGAIRVGGKKGVSYPDRGSDFDYVNAWLTFPHQLDLDFATRAELIVEKILSHNGTNGLAIQWNNSDWIKVPEPAGIKQPRHQYYHHSCITVPISLENLEVDDENRFRLRVAPEQDWGWPQHLIYGVHLRVYYDVNQKRHVKGTIQSPIDGQKLGLDVPLAVAIQDRWRRVNRVDYLASYRGINWEGDGEYRRWHYFSYHGQLTHHIGSELVAPFTRRWDTTWVPDQIEHIQIAARIVDDTGLIYLTTAITDLRLDRPGYSVELCTPENVPSNWVTRNGSHEQTVDVVGDLSKATAAKLLWSSWSPGYMNGLFVNGQRIIQAQGPKYRYYDHDVRLDDLSILKSGRNTTSTGKTPLYNGKMVHGMEVNWPGIQLLIQYRSTSSSPSRSAAASRNVKLSEVWPGRAGLPSHPMR